MKKILFGLTLWALAFVAIPRVSRAEVSVDFFYNNMPGGSWVEVEDYGYGWQPEVAVSDADWRPYADGYWAYTDYGWTWVSYEDFGWATYHYGRWARIEDMGWVWFPGSDLEWGPAWVSWRTGGDQIGWAPLPPRAGVVYEGQPIGGHVDVEFDIGPAYYNFVDIRYIGEPVLRTHIYAPSYNVTYINQTVNVTNITVKNKTVYNYGPDVNVLAQHSARPIQRLKIERQNNVDFSAAARGGGLTKVQGDKLIVAAPQTIQRPGKQVAPPVVKTKVEKTRLERGWKGIADENTKAQLKQKIQTEDSTKIPPPVAAAPQQQQPAGGAPPAGPKNANAAPSTAVNTAPNAPATTGGPVEKGKHRRPEEKAQADAAQTTEPPNGERPTREQPKISDRRKGKEKSNQPAFAPAPPTGATNENAEANSSEGGVKNKHGRPMPSDAGPSNAGQTGTAEGPVTTGKHQNRRLAPGEVPAGAESGQPQEGRMGRSKMPPSYAPPQGQGPRQQIQPGQGQPQGRPEHAKKKKGDKEQPEPTP
jgi:hypothetical protein